jgi:RND family efflux transporter MFP subunit
MKKTPKILATVLIIAALGGFAGWRIWQAYEKKSATEKAAQARKGGGAARVITVSVARARTGPVRQDIEITGSLKPKEQVDVTSKVTGRVQRLLVQVGDFVRQGQLIAELEDLEMAQQVRRAEAAQEVVRATEQQRKAELSNAKADADRSKQLFDQGLLSRQEYEAKLTAYRVFQAQVALVAAQADQAAAELRELTIQRAQMKIYAPISGFVAQKYVDTGAVVSPSTPVARVVNLSTMVMVGNVPEKEVGRLRVGNRAVVTFDAFGQEEYTARIARIAPVLDAATRTALVEVEIPNPNGALKAEMFARVRLDIGQMRDAVLIPRDSLVYRGQQAGVFVVEAEKPIFRSINTGASHGNDIEVLANLQPGTPIVNRGASILEEGDQIRVVEQKEAELDKKKEGASNDGAAVTPAARFTTAG